jgi:hypothetical protein
LNTDPSSQTSLNIFQSMFPKWPQVRFLRSLGLARHGRCQPLDSPQRGEMFVSSDVCYHMNSDSNCFEVVDRSNQLQAEHCTYLSFCILCFCVFCR